MSKNEQQPPPRLIKESKRAFPVDGVSPVANLMIAREARHQGIGASACIDDEAVQIVNPASPSQGR